MKTFVGLSYKKKVIALIIILSIIGFIVASSVELGNDESYYWLYSQKLKWNYFDHPPMVAIWIRLFTANLLLQKYVCFLRLGSIVACGLSTWFMYKCITVLSSQRAGWFGACLYNASFYTGITAGLFIMPDSPQMVFFTFSLWMIAKFTINNHKWLYWILFGVSSGLCIMSKVHGVFIWIGLGFFILLKRRNWLTNSRLYIAIFIALIITCPIFIWNIQNNFATYNFQSERVVVSGFPLSWNNFIHEFIGQFIINNPINVVLIILGFFSWKKYSFKQLTALSIYNFISLPLAFLLLFISLFRQTLPHWSGPAYVALMPLAAIRLDKINKQIIFPNSLRWSVGTYTFFLIICTCTIRFYPGNFGNKTKENLGAGDLTLDMYGWREAGKKFDSIYYNEISKGIMQKNSPVVCYKWWGAHLEYYFCYPQNIQMIGLGTLDSLHEYMWMNKMRNQKVNFNTAYCIVPSNDNYNVHAQYDNYYAEIDSVTIIKIFRANKPAINFSVFRLKGWKNNLPEAK